MASENVNIHTLLLVGSGRVRVWKINIFILRDAVFPEQSVSISALSACVAVSE